DSRLGGPRRLPCRDCYLAAATLPRARERKAYRMTPLLLASEGGYQPFHLGSSDKFVLLFSGVTALLAIAVGFFLAKGVLAADQGTPKMMEIAKAIQEGALAYLKRQFRTIVLILIPLAAVVFLTSVKVVKPDGSVALS